MKKKSIGAIIATMLLTVTPAHAETFSVSASKINSLAAAGDSISITVAGIPANQGFYVRLCQGTTDSAKTARPENCFGQGIWASTDAAQLAYGAVDATKTLTLAVQAQFGSGASAVDCQKVACGIHVRRDHNGGTTDFSLDRFIPVTFVGGSVATASTSTAPQALIIGAGPQVYVELSHVNGKTVVITVGKKKIAKKYKVDSAHFAAPLTKGVTSVTVAIDGRVISKKSVKY